MDAIMGESDQYKICAVEPTLKYYGEVYDTLYFGVFITLLPFLFIIVFDFNVLYVVRHRPGIVSSKSSMSSSTISHNLTSAAARRCSRQLDVSLSVSSNRAHSRGHLVPDKLTVMLVLSSCFLLLNLPYFIIWLLYTFLIQTTLWGDTLYNTIPTDTFNNVSFTGRTISGLTYSVNGAIYIISDRAFRADIVDLFRKCFEWRKNRKSQQSNRSSGRIPVARTCSNVSSHQHHHQQHLLSNSIDSGAENTGVQHKIEEKNTLTAKRSVRFKDNVTKGNEVETCFTTITEESGAITNNTKEATIVPVVDTLEKVIDEHVANSAPPSPAPQSPRVIMCENESKI